MEIIENSVYTYVQVQKMLGVKRTVLARLIKEKAIHPLQLGKTYMFLGSKLLEDLRKI